MTLTSYRRLLRSNRNFRLLWFAQIISELGDWVYSIALVSFLLELTGSARMVAFVFLLQVLPQALTAPIAGVINDRMSRKKIMIGTDLARAVIILSMVFVRSRESLWLLFVLLFLETVCWGLFEPGRSAVVPNIVEPEDIPAANALSGSTWSIIFAGGAALGGAATVVLGRNAVFVLNSISFLISAALIMRMRFSEPHLARDGSELDGGFKQIADGVRYLTRDRRLLAAAMVKGGIGTMGANWVILPVMGERFFPVKLSGLDATQASTLGMSIMFAARGAGALCGSFWAAGFGGGHAPRLRRIILRGFLLSGIGYIALGTIAGSLGIAALVLILGHMGGATCWTSATTILQQKTEDRYRGRVFSAEAAFMTITLSASSFIAGQSIDRGIDPRTVAVATGLVTLVPAFLWWLANRPFSEG